MNQSFFKQFNSIFDKFLEIREVFIAFFIEMFDVVNDSIWSLIKMSGLPAYVDFFGSDRVNLSYGATALSEQIYYVYHLIMFVELFLLIALLWIIGYILIVFKEKGVNGTTNRYFVHYNKYLHKKLWTSKVLEFFWTLLPVFVLIYIGYPSLVLLYSFEERINPELIVKVVGHQWYWHYEVEGFNLKFDLFNEIFDDTDEFLERIRLPLQGGVFIRVMWHYPLYHLYEDDVIWNMIPETTGNYLLLNRGESYLFFPRLDSDLITYVFKDSFKSYSCAFDLGAVENDKEYLSAVVGKLVASKELNALSFDIADRFEQGQIYDSFNWVNYAVDSFRYKYMWLSVDYTGDYVKFHRIGALLNLDSYSDILMLKDVEFDSYLIKDYDLLYKGEKRMLEVDNRLVLPSRTHIQFLVTAADVIHSFAIPDFGVKIDAIPGRLNQCFVFVKYEGTFFGQCSELCGVDHGFMPIVIDIVNYNYYMTSVRTCSNWESSSFYQSGLDHFLVK